MKNSLRKRIKKIMFKYGIVFLCIEFNKLNQIQFLRATFPLHGEYYRLNNIKECSIGYQNHLFLDFHYFVYFYHGRDLQKKLAISKEIYEFLLLDFVYKIEDLNPKTFKMKHSCDIQFIHNFHYRPIQFSFLL